MTTNRFLTTLLQASIAIPTMYLVRMLWRDFLEEMRLWRKS
jgi:hypothetical protein